MSQSGRQFRPTMTDEEMLACATEFTLIAPAKAPPPIGHVRELKVAIRNHQPPQTWAIVNAPFVLNRLGEWEHEPQPNARSPRFLSRCRWPTAREAIAFAEEHMRKHPTGYKPVRNQE